MKWIGNYIRVKHWDAITHQRPTFNGGLIKLSFKLGMDKKLFPTLNRWCNNLFLHLS